MENTNVQASSVTAFDADRLIVDVKSGKGGSYEITYTVTLKGDNKAYQASVLASGPFDAPDTVHLLFQMAEEAMNTMFSGKVELTQ